MEEEEEEEEEEEAEEEEEEEMGDSLGSRQKGRWEAVDSGPVTRTAMIKKKANAVGCYA